MTIELLVPDIGNFNSVEVIEILVSYWYQDLNLAVQIPSPEWRSNIQHLQQQGLSEAAAITNWTAQLKLSHPLGVCVNHKKHSEFRTELFS